MSELSITTTQNVNINFTAATVGERMGASLLDLLVKIAYGIAVYYIFFNLLNFDSLMNGADQWSQMAIVLFFAFPALIYSVTLESIFEGQTIGKKLLKIKVVKIDGYQASFPDYFIRWLFRFIENNLMGGLIGLIALATSKKVQRLGDIAAGTAVISLKNNINISHTILEEIATDYQPSYPLVIKLSDNDIRIIKETFLAADKIDDDETINKLAQKIEKVTGIVNQSGSKSTFIKILLKDYSFYTQNM